MTIERRKDNLDKQEIGEGIVVDTLKTDTSPLAVSGEPFQGRRGNLTTAVCFIPF